MLAALLHYTCVPNAESFRHFVPSLPPMLSHSPVDFLSYTRLAIVPVFAHVWLGSTSLAGQRLFVPTFQHLAVPLLTPILALAWLSTLFSNCLNCSTTLCITSYQNSIFLWSFAIDTTQHGYVLSHAVRPSAISFAISTFCRSSSDSHSTFSMGASATSR